MDSRSRVYVAGNTGMVGSAIVRMLHRKGYTNIFSTPSSHFDLRRQDDDERYFRPAEVETLLGDPSKAKQKLGWEPKTSFKQLVEDMVLYGQ